LSNHPIHVLKQGGSEIAQSPMPPVNNDERQGVVSIEGIHSEFGYMATMQQNLPLFGGAPNLDGVSGPTAAATGFYNQGLNGQKSQHQQPS